MTDSRYQILLLSAETDEAWHNEVRSAVVNDAASVIGSPDAIEWLKVEDVAAMSNEKAAAVVLLASLQSSSDQPILESLDVAADRALPILPVVRFGQRAEQVLPMSYQHLNACLEDPDDPSVVARAVLRILGVTDELRRVFISYRRTETTPLAEQLHTEMTRRGFAVFLDRFGVALADNFQQRIDIELCDKAFVLLLESPGITDSPWVHHEITYAQANQLGVLALTLPSTASHQRVTTVHDGSRLELHDADLDADGSLTTAALVDLLAELELAHSRVMRARREYMLGSLRNYLTGHGCDVSPVDEWAVLATASDKVSEVFSVTPTSPSVEDLWRVGQIRDRLRDSQPNGLRATVVHDADALDSNRAGVFGWVGSVSDLSSALLRNKPGVLEDSA